MSSSDDNFRDIQDEIRRAHIDDVRDNYSTTPEEFESLAGFLGDSIVRSAMGKYFERVQTKMANACFGDSKLKTQEEYAFIHSIIRALTVVSIDLQSIPDVYREYLEEYEGAGQSGEEEA